jgi:hypothetical protein
MTYLETFFEIELISSALLIMVLLFVGITKKEKILSDTALNRLKGNWGTFKTIFYFAFVGMVMFLFLLTLEFVEVGRGAILHTLYPMEIELIKVFLVTVLIVMNVLNLRLVLLLVGGGE